MTAAWITRLAGPNAGLAAALALNLTLGLATVPAQAQSAYPNHPLRLIVPYSTGGPGDILARQISPKLSEFLGQPIIIDNRGGAGAIVGTEAAAKSAPDGYTLYLSTDGPISINPSLYAKLPYDPVRDFTPVTLLASARQVLAVSPSVSAKSVAELIALARAQPGKLNYASFGSGSLGHLAAEMFKSLTGTDITHIPFKGTAQALQALIAGDVQLMFVGEPGALPHTKSGRLRALASSGPRRSVLFPDIPTVAETGVTGYDVQGLFGLMLPAGAPQEVVARLNAEAAKALAAPEVLERMRAIGFEPQPTTPQAFAALIESEIAKWAKVVRASGAKPD
jgi:tripartite-type tricarboxylate transporter receptor subunit TctC